VLVYTTHGNIWHTNVCAFVTVAAHSLVICDMRAVWCFASL